LLKNTSNPIQSIQNLIQETTKPSVVLIKFTMQSTRLFHIWIRAGIPKNHTTQRTNTLTTAKAY
jgi:hypothetical protein